MKEEEEEKSIRTGGQKPKNAKRRSVASKVTYKEESDSEREGLSDGEEFQMTSEEESEDSEGGAKDKNGKKGKGKNKVITNNNNNNTNTATKRKSGGGGRKNKNEEEEEDEDWEDVGEVEEGGTSKSTKRRSRKKREGRGADEWLEVYLQKTASWICVDVEHGVGRPQLCSQNATVPLTYVVSVDGAGHLKDLGRKYDPTWMTSSRKRRVDEDWWEDTLEPFLGPEDERDMQEDKEVRQTYRKTDRGTD